MFRKFSKTILLALFGAILGISAASFAAPKFNKVQDENRQTYEQLVLFADVLSRVEHDYIEEVDPVSLVSDALNGALQALDPHSHYSPPAKYEKQQKRSKREYGGLGIEVSMKDGYVLVGYANKNGPAFKAGIVAGDLITHVEGVSIKDKTLNQAVEKMRGLAGDAITITVKSKNRSGRKMVIIREVVQGRAIQNRMVEGFGYLYLETFNNANLARDMDEAIDILKTENGGALPGLILDLRENGGGLLTQSVAVSSFFLDGGEVLSVRGRKAENNDRYHATLGEKLKGVPLIVLISSNSASASEIVAGALQDRGRAIIMGTQSFGKGSVQSIYPLKGGKDGALRLTTDRYFTPSGRSIQGLGITPDIWVEAYRLDENRSQMKIRESTLPNSLDAIIQKTEGKQHKRAEPKHEFPPKDWSKARDYQLHRAVELLKSGTYKQTLTEAYGDK